MPTFCLNFKRDFADAVANGSKRQTIRPHRKDGKRIQPGDQLKLYTGLRTSSTRLLRQASCDCVLAIRIGLANGGDVVIDGTKLDAQQRTEFAQADGFTDWPSMRTWFRDQYGGTDEFEGFLVRWSA